MNFTIYGVNNKDADQSPWMRRLISFLFTYGINRFCHELAQMKYGLDLLMVVTLE